jgi:hypothetical protein
VSKVIAKCPLILSLVGALVGCSSTGSFQPMHPHERADKVCRGSDAYRDRQKTFESVEKYWAEQKKLADNGYKVIKTCQQTYKNKYETTGKTCTENIVPIDVSKAENNVEIAYQRARYLKINDQRITDECIARVMKLPPE